MRTGRRPRLSVSPVRPTLENHVEPEGVLNRIPGPVPIFRHRIQKPAVAPAPHATDATSQVGAWLTLSARRETLPVASAVRGISTIGEVRKSTSLDSLNVVLWNLTRRRAAQRRAVLFEGQKARFRLICWAFPRQSVQVPWRRRAALHSGIERLSRTYQGAGEPAAPSSSGLGARSAYLLRADAG